MTTTTNIQIGTLIHGTLRNEDLLQAFSDELARIDLAKFEEVIKDDAHLFAESANLTIDGIVEGLGEHVDDVINDLMDALNEYAPAHTYFGTLEGDGSDFGFWADTDSFEDCDKHVMETPSPLRGDTEWFDLDCGVIVQVNDHGNITVSQPYCDIENHPTNTGTNLCKVGVCLVAGHEIWSAV